MFYSLYIDTTDFVKKKVNASGGIRTHEAEAQDLKTCPFDHSGTLAQIKFADLIKCSWRGLNSRPTAHKTVALTTELQELMFRCLYIFSATMEGFRLS